MRAAKKLSSRFVTAHPADAARVLERLPREQASALLADLPPSLAASSFTAMSPVIAAERLASLSDRRGGDVLAALAPDVARGLLLRMQPDERERLLSHVAPAAADALRQRLAYPEGTAGALMDPRVLSLPERLTAGEALARVRRSARYAHYYLFVVDAEGTLTGVLTLRELLQAAPGAGLDSLMSEPEKRIRASAGRAEIVANDGWRHLHALPVVDDDGRFLGLIRHETFRELERIESATRGEGELGSIGFAFAELCWTGMAAIVDEVAAAALRRRLSEDRPGGGSDVA